VADALHNALTITIINKSRGLFGIGAHGVIVYRIEEKWEIVGDCGTIPEAVDIGLYGISYYTSE